MPGGWRKPVLEALEDKVLIGDGCWEWTGAKNPNGYGQLRVDYQLIPAHRVIWDLLKGPCPEGLEPDHLCRNPGCVRPDHLEWVTHGENVRRGRSGAKNAAKTHCPQGHPYDEVNTYSHPGKRRRDCRECLRESSRRYKARKRGAA